MLSSVRNEISYAAVIMIDVFFGSFTSQDPPPHPSINGGKEAAHEAWLGWVGSELLQMGCNEVDVVRLTRPAPTKDLTRHMHKWYKSNLLGTKK